MSLNQNILWFLFDSLFQIPETIWENTEEFVLYIQLGAIQKVRFFEREGGGSWKSEQKPTGAGVPIIYFQNEVW